jgi:hypothetical protein
MEDIKYLSNALKIIVDYELSIGNEVGRIDRPAGTRCPLSVVFKKPLDFKGFEELRGKLEDVDTWENSDRHYDLEAGYFCEKTRQAIAGPK